MRLKVKVLACVKQKQLCSFVKVDTNFQQKSKSSKNQQQLRPDSFYQGFKMSAHFFSVWDHRKQKTAFKCKEFWDVDGIWSPFLVTKTMFQYFGMKDSHTHTALVCETFLKVWTKANSTHNYWAQVEQAGLSVRLTLSLRHTLQEKPQKQEKVGKWFILWEKNNIIT